MANSFSPRPALRRARIALAAVLLLLPAGWLIAHDAAPNRPHFGQGTVRIANPTGTSHSFDVEVARSDAEQEYGLMFVRHLRDGHGMIFPYDPPRQVAYWMKNTLIPLDMIFVTADGHIGRIVANAVPNDVTPIPSGLPVSAVIEINGGLAARDGLAEGDTVAFTPSAVGKAAAP